MVSETAVIFDMDGVIADTNPTHSEAFRRFFDERNISYTDEEFVQHMYGKHNTYIMNHFFKRQLDPAEVKAYAEEKEALFRKLYGPYVKPVAGLLPFIARLKAGGLKTAVATSAPRENLNLIVDKLALRSQMNALLSSEDVTRHKPDPEIYLKTADRLETAPARCVVFEDSHSGVSAALNAGMQVVGVLTSHEKEELPPCRYYIRTYHDLDGISLDDLIR